MIKLEFDPQWLYILLAYSIGIIITIIGFAHLEQERRERKWKDAILRELTRIKLEQYDIQSNNELYNGELSDAQEESIVNYWTNRGGER